MAVNKGINWDEQPLGKVSDNKLARSLGVDQSNVSQARRRRGIKPLHTRGFKGKGINWDKQPLGEKMDREIADSLNVSVQSVCQARQKRGILPYSKKMIMEKIKETVEFGHLTRPLKNDTHENNCGRCEWWVPRSPSKSETPRGREFAGYCHGGPPIYVSNFGWVWPNTGEKAWCSFFKKREGLTD